MTALAYLQSATDAAILLIGAGLIIAVSAVALATDRSMRRLKDFVRNRCSQQGE
jgi:hypothetical protein